MYCKLIKSAAAAVPFLKEGRLVAFPTGTSYGLAADALQGFALQRLMNLKGRPSNKAFTVFMPPSLWSEFLALTPEEESVLLKLQSQPVTLLVKPRPDLSHLTQEGRIGLRIIDHPLMASLAKAAAVPLTATSANPSGRQPAAFPTQIQGYFPGRLDDSTYDLSLAAILDAGSLPVSLPSTIIKIIHSREFQTLRPGAISSSRITSLLASST